MRTIKAIIYNEDGETIRKIDVHLRFTSGEPHPRDRVIALDFPFKNGKGMVVNIGLRTLEKACGLKVRRVSRR